MVRCNGAAVDMIGGTLTSRMIVRLSTALHVAPGVTASPFLTSGWLGGGGWVGTYLCCGLFYLIYIKFLGMRLLNFATVCGLAIAAVLSGCVSKKEYVSLQAKHEAL